MSAPSTTSGFIANVLQSLSTNFFADVTNTDPSTPTIISSILSNELSPIQMSPPTPTQHPHSFPALVASSNNFDHSSLSMRSERGNMTIRRMISPPTNNQDPATQNNTVPVPPVAVAVPVTATAGTAVHPPPHLLGGAVVNSPWMPSNLPCIQFTTNLSNSYSTIVSTKHSRTIETHSCTNATSKSSTSVEYIFYTKHTHSQFTYFEVKLADKLFSNTSSAPEVALGFAPYGYKGMVGWSKNSIGFHVDNGRVYDEQDSTNKIADRVFLSHINRGDVIGCLLNHKNGEFLVVKNGQELHNIPFGTSFKRDHFKQSHHFLPTISCSDIHLEMEVNLGLDMVRKPFLYPRVVLFRQLERLLAMVVGEHFDSWMQDEVADYNFTDVRITTQCSHIKFEEN